MSRLTNVVIQTAFLGDVILSIPVLQRIKKIFPQQDLIIVCKKNIGDFLKEEKIVDDFMEVEKSNSASYKSVLKKLNNLEINNLFCIHRSLRSLRFSYQLKAKNKIGFSSFLGSWVFDELVEYKKDQPDVLRQFSIIETVDKETHSELRLKDYSILNSNELPDIPQFFSFSQRKKQSNGLKKIAFFPGSVWATKKWTKSGYVELAKLFIQKGFQVDLLGGAEERDLCSEIAQEAGDAVGNLAGQLSILQTIRQLSDYALVVCNDSSPTHMASYMDVPVVSIFGPTVLSQGFRPWTNKAAVVQNEKITCRPCGKHGHQQCPLGHHECMKSIKAQDVLIKCLSVLTS